MIKAIAAVRSDEKVLEAVIVIVADRDSHAVALALQPRSFGYVLEGAVCLLVIQPIPVLRAGLLRNRSFRRRIVQGSAVYEK